MTVWLVAIKDTGGLDPLGVHSTEAKADAAAERIRAKGYEVVVLPYEVDGL